MCRISKPAQKNDGNFLVFTVKSNTVKKAKVTK